MKKMLMITGCSNSSFWYAGKAGAVVDYLGFDKDEFITREPSGYVNIVKAQDGQLVDVVPAVPEAVGSLYRLDLVLEFKDREAAEALPLITADLKRAIADFLEARTYRCRLTL